jgi:hypothetical protein
VKQFKVLLLFFILLSWLTACAQLLVDQTQSGARPAILVQYHVWFRGDHACPYTGWYDWDGWIHSPDTSYDPCTTPYGPSWLRQTSAVVYPYIGPYRSGPDIYRWHIRLAKAAGITGFLVSIPPGNATSCGGNEGELRARFMDMLQVAYQENFKIGFEGQGPYGCSSVSTFYDTIRSEIDEAEASPYASALLKINGLTPFWFVTWKDYDTWANITSNLLNTRDVFWIIMGPQTQSDLNTARASLTNNAQLTRTPLYDFPATGGGCAYHGDFTTLMSELVANNFTVITHGYPGFDERATGLGSGRYCPWNNYTVLNNYLDSAQSGGTDYIILESWNDLTEWTNLEPAIDIKQYRDLGQETLYQGDPYRTLKQIAAWRGVEWHTPFLDCAIVDPVLQQHGVVECGTAPPPPPAGAIWPAAPIDLVAQCSADGTQSTLSMEQCEQRDCLSVTDKLSSHCGDPPIRL